jgi:hypothetical protein
MHSQAKRVVLSGDPFDSSPSAVATHLNPEGESRSRPPTLCRDPVVDQARAPSRRSLSCSVGHTVSRGAVWDSITTIPPGATDTVGCPFGKIFGTLGCRIIFEMGQSTVRITHNDPPGVRSHSTDSGAIQSVPPVRRSVSARGTRSYDRLAPGLRRRGTALPMIKMEVIKTATTGRAGPEHQQCSILKMRTLGN